MKGARNAHAPKARNASGLTPRGRKLWTSDEDKTLRALYPVKGLAACLASLPGRTKLAVQQRAVKLCLRLHWETRSDIAAASSPFAQRGPKVAPPPASIDVGAFDAVAHAWARRRERRAT